LVSAAASLTEAFKEISPLFSAKNPGTVVRLNFAATGPLLQQIAQGAPVDVFAAADQESMDKAEKNGLLRPGSRKNFAVNALVLVTPPEQTRVAGLADLASTRVGKIAVGNPDSVPAGRYAKAALLRQGLWESLTSKYVMAISVKQAMEYVQRGEVEAGFVYASDAVAAKGRVRVAAEVPAIPPIVYPAAVVAASQHRIEAEAFIRFLAEKQAQDILAKYGFRRQ
ncbi:MAG: molybdate ABC transporter substrate-binding protein, partial [Thermodesulfobacteriota bacterium]